jgi:glycosyltransferase involved in cell wall biosynthesis
MPRVSVVMNCFNGERYLRAAIDSVVAQTFQDWELIFWDNASTDGSAEIVRSYGDFRLRYFRGAHTVPLGAARKLAMEKVRGDWIGFLDTDDLWYEHKLARQLSALDGTAHVLCYSGINEINSDGSLLRKVRPAYRTGSIFEQQLMNFDINMVSPLIRKRTLEERRLNFNPEVTASEEYNLFLRIIVHGTVCVIEEPLAAWRIGSGTLTDRQMRAWATERLLTLEQLEVENPGISARLPRAFGIAKARAEYYRARYLMSQGAGVEARAALRPILSADPAYRVLFLLTFSRSLWELAHSTRVKRTLLPRLWSLVAPK